jgi:hypothetical protein
MLMIGWVREKKREKQMMYELETEKGRIDHVRGRTKGGATCITDFQRFSAHRVHDRLVWTVIEQECIGRAKHPGCPRG